MHVTKSLVCVLFHTVLCVSYSPRTFHLVKHCQRSKQSIVELENVSNLHECFKVAEQSRALALNYSPLRGIRLNLFQTNRDLRTDVDFPRRSHRRHFLEQPEEFFNCHALQCPESSAFTTMVNDSRFDYYSLYGDPPVPKNFTCVSEIGVFQLNSTPEKYEAAFRRCNGTIKGTLAHVASELRTVSLSKLLQGSDYINGSLKLAYVGLNSTGAQSRGFKTSENEDLTRFLYRAWAPGHPKWDTFLNSSCVAITTEGTWMTIDCERKLPYICEINAAPLNVSLYEDACDRYLPHG